jgi:hypothetical protein
MTTQNWGQVPILSTSRDPATARLRVASASRSEMQIALGEYFLGASKRLAVPVGDVQYSVV